MNDLLGLKLNRNAQSPVNISMPLIQFICGGLLTLVISSASIAVSQFLDPIDSGWYRSQGGTIDHISTNRNFLVGDLTDGTTYRNFFVFDLSGVQQSIVSATFSALVSNDLGVANPAGTFEMWTIFDVSTDIAVLTAGTLPNTTYQDLGSGTVLGSMTFSTADRGQPVSFQFNAAGLAEMNNANGLWAFGGAVTTLDNPTRSESIFHDSGLNSLARLSINVPEPSTSFLVILATLACLYRRRVHAIFPRLFS